MQQLQLSVSPEQLTELAQAWLDAERYSTNVAGFILGALALICIICALKYRKQGSDGYIISLGVLAFIAALSVIVFLSSLPLYRDNALSYAKMKVMTSKS